jgi:NAD(P)-dependent dehydrogenase (short-subunit alcohol dehydrogenase family)
MSGVDHKLRDRVAIVTGAGKGLGKAYALHLASLGATVVVNNRISNDPPGASSADAVVGEIRALGGHAIASYADVEAVDAGEQLVAAALQHYGRLDIVVSNAGIDRAGSFHKLQMADFETVMNINFLSVARLLRAAWPHLREAGYGRVLVSTSTAGLYGNHGQAAYASSKAALLGLVRSLAIEGETRGVLINAIAPYAVTQLTRPWFPEGMVERFSPEAVAPLAGWLVSERCELTGKTLVAGAGSARLAHPLETDSIILGEDPQVAMEKLLQLSCGESPPATAGAEFEDFMRSLPRQPG